MRGGGGGHAFVSHVVRPADSFRQLDGYALDVAGFKKWIVLRKVGPRAAKARHSHPGFR